MLLGRYKTEQEARAGYEAACKEPGAITMEARGQVLLGKFTGVSVDKVNKDVIDTSVVQKRKIESLKDLQDIHGEAASAHQRFNRHASKSHQDTEIRGPRISHSEVEHCLSVDDVKAHDVLKNPILREIEDKNAMLVEQDDHLADEAAAAKQQVDEQKKKADGKQSKTSLDLDLEIETLKTAVKSAETEFQASRLNWTKDIKTIEAAAEKLAADSGNEAFQKGVVEKTTACDTALGEVKVYHAEVIKSYTDWMKTQGLTAEACVKKRKDLKEVVKSASKHDKIKDVKTAIQDLT
eukprot:6221526-Pyramimonas_sp.AAC.1